MLWLALLLQIEIPRGITYKLASDSVNAPIQRMLEKDFGGGGSAFGDENLYGDVVVAGPTLWNEIEQMPDIKNGNVTRTAFRIGHQGDKVFALEGGLFNDRDTVGRLRSTLAALIKPGEKFRVRKLNAIEMKHIWNDINAWDIEEPVFALESDSRVLILDFAPHPQITSLTESPKREHPYRLYFVDDVTPVEKH